MCLRIGCNVVMLLRCIGKFLEWVQNCIGALRYCARLCMGVLVSGRVGVFGVWVYWCIGCLGCVGLGVCVSWCIGCFGCIDGSVYRLVG